jgi:hypothetical protein
MYRDSILSISYDIGNLILLLLCCDQGSLVLLGAV